MSDNKQPDTMRPIPDGGLKDAMPAWLKRPPAWRNMPTAEERHERTLPEPDTSVIDPHSLLDVSDLPQWLQTIAERGNMPVPEPDPVIVHGVEQVQAATRHHHNEPAAAPETGAAVEQLEPTSDIEVAPETSIEVTKTTESTPAQEVATPTQVSTPEESRSPWTIPLIAIGLVVILAVVVLLIIL